MSTFRLQFASDLHLERLRAPVDESTLRAMITPAAPYLALLGDISVPSEHDALDLYARFLYTQCARFEHVFVIAGNHEYYVRRARPLCDFTHVEIDRTIASVCAERDNLTFLNNRTFDIGGVRLVGSTLWSDIDAEVESIVKRDVADYRYIVVTGTTRACRVTPDTTREWFRSNVAFVQRELDRARVDCVPVLVLTHHAPMHHSSNPSSEGSIYTSAFSSDLTSLIQAHSHAVEGALVGWLFGHTHYNTVRDERGVVVACNQRGYEGETTGLPYSPTRVVCVTHSVSEVRVQVE